jgi:hypothetical protein
MHCEFCNKDFANVSSFNWHVKTAKKCLEKRGIKAGVQCKDCGKMYTVQTSLDAHIKSGVCQKRKLKDDLIDVKVTKEEYDMLSSYRLKKALTPESLPIIDVKHFDKTVEGSLLMEDCISFQSMALFFKRIVKGSFIVTEEKTILNKRNEGIIEMDTNLFVRTLLPKAHSSITNYLHANIDCGYLYDMRSMIEFIGKSYLRCQVAKLTISIEELRTLTKAEDLLECIKKELLND